MASVTWTGHVKVALSSAPESDIEFPAASFDDESSGRSQVRIAVDGTARSYELPGIPRTFRLRARYVTRTDVDSLREWIGVPCYLRGPAGRTVWGVLDRVQANDVAGPTDNGVSDVVLVFTETYGTAAV